MEKCLWANPQFLLHSLYLEFQAFDQRAIQLSNGSQALFCSHGASTFIEEGSNQLVAQKHY